MEEEKKGFNIKSFIKGHIKILIIGAILVILILAVILPLSMKKEKWSPISQGETKIEVNTIKESILNISELSTLSYYYGDVAVFIEEKSKFLGIPLLGTGKSFIVLYYGEMKIGIDASQLSVEVTDNKIIINMPSAKVLSHSVDESSVSLYDEKSGLFNPISVTDYLNLISERKAEMEEKAYSNGLFSQAQENAEEQIKSLLMLIPGIADEYEIDFVLIQ